MSLFEVLIKHYPLLSPDLSASPMDAINYEVR
jgi:hypothetical protein